MAPKKDKIVCFNNFIIFVKKISETLLRAIFKHEGIKTIL